MSEMATLNGERTTWRIINVCACALVIMLVTSQSLGVVALAALEYAKPTNTYTHTDTLMKFI